MNTKTLYTLLVASGILLALLAIGYTIGKLDTAIIAEESGPPAARFAIGDEGVTFHKFCYTGECTEIIYDAWMRCDPGFVDCYWQTSDGRYGFAEGSGWFPFMPIAAAETSEETEKP